MIEYDYNCATCGFRTKLHIAADIHKDKNPTHYMEKISSLWGYKFVDKGPTLERI